MDSTSVLDKSNVDTPNHSLNSSDNGIIVTDGKQYELEEVSSIKVLSEDDEQSIHTKRANELLDKPSNIHSFIEEYKGGGEAYSKIIGGLDTGSFDDFMKLQNLFVKANYDEAGRVTRWIEYGLARSIKNSILDESSTFPVTTLVDVNERLKAYRDIGIDVPTVFETIETTIEALYDNDWENALHVVEGLLYETPDASLHSNEDIDDSIDLLLRLKATMVVDSDAKQGTLNYKTVEKVVDSYANLTNTPLIPDRKINGNLNDKSIKEMFAIAEDRSYEDIIKKRMYGYICHYDSRCFDAFVEYLYLSGRNIVEDQRHGMEKPTRARLALAEKQFKTVNLLSKEGIVNRSEKEVAWSLSHYHVSRGALKASGWVESQRENQPKPEFESAATEYVHASSYLVDKVPVRAMKYRSKAFRYAAKRTSRTATIAIHDKAVEYLINIAVEIDEPYFTASVQDRIRYHLFKKYENQIDQAYINGEYSVVNSLYYESISIAKSIKIPMKTHNIEKKHLTSQAKRAEAEQDYETAIAAYEQLNKSTTFIQNRKTLIKIKKLITDGKPEQALEVSNEFSGSHKVIHDALYIINDQYPDGGFGLEDKISQLALPVTDSIENVERENEHVIKHSLNTDNFAGLADKDVSKLFLAIKNAVNAPIIERNLFKHEVERLLMKL